MNKGGRPPKYKTPEEMEAAAESYFQQCDENEKPYTIAGLAYHLGFLERHGLIEQAERVDGGFSPTIKKLRLRCEVQKSERLADNKGNPAGLIFDLKNNFGWKDKQEIEHTGTLTLAEAIAERDNGKSNT